MLYCYCINNNQFLGKILSEFAFICSANKAAKAARTQFALLCHVII